MRRLFGLKKFSYAVFYGPFFKFSAWARKKMSQLFLFKNSGLTKNIAPLKRRSADLKKTFIYKVLSIYQNSSFIVVFFVCLYFIAA